MELKDKKVVVIGGSSGIGLAVVRSAAQAGALVLLASRSEPKLRQAKAAIGGRTGIYPLDLREEAQVRHFFDQVGAFDHLVVTAAEGAVGRFLEQEEGTVQGLFAVKFWGQYRAAKLAAPRLRTDGSITLFSGLAARKPPVGFSAYAAVNGAINALCRALAVELAPLRVNAVAPGIIDTPAYADMPEAQRHDFFAAVGDRLPVRRIGQPEDVAEAVLLLMRNAFITGTLIEVDGGGRLA